MNKIISRVLLFSMLFILSCKKQSNLPPILPPINSAQNDAFGDRNSVFGWSLFQEVYSSRPAENILISPYSIHTALNMLLNGTSGATRLELLDFFNCPTCDVAEINAMQQQIDLTFKHYSGAAKINVANAFFHDPARIAPLASFRTALDTAFNAKWQEENFNSPTAINTINDWVATQTQQRILKIIESISGDDVAFIINALHFQSDWEVGFAPEMTSEKTFTLSNGQQIAVPFVMADRDFATSQFGDYEMVDIPFKGEQFSFSLIQPKTTTSNWVEKLTKAQVDSLYENLNEARAMVSFPKFEIDFAENLVPSLQNLGLSQPFSPGEANLSAMGTSLLGQNLYAKNVLHKTFLKVDEKGAEGAAVTSIGVGVTSMPPYFGFDQPFVIVLRHVSSGTQLFVGYVADPS